MKVKGGFSLLELLAVLIIISLTVSFFIAPNQALIVESNLKTTAEKFLSHLELARSYALSNYDQVSLCASTDGTSCGGDKTNWAKGYLIKLSDDSLIHYESENKDSSIRIIKNSNSDVNFYGSGFVSASNNTRFGICSQQTQRLYWIAITNSRNSQNLAYQPFLCTLQLEQNISCSNLTNSDVSQKEIKSITTIIDNQTQKDCFN